MYKIEVELVTVPVIARDPQGRYVLDTHDPFLAASSEPQLDSLRSDPRFQDMIKRMGLPK